MKCVLKFFKWTGITLGVLLVLFVSINAFDEDLEPGAAAILNSESKVPAAENAYFYWAGMYTALSNNPSEIGEQCVKAQQRVSEFGAFNIEQKAVPECRELTVLEAAVNKSVDCEWRKQSCLNHYYDQRAAIEKLATQNQAIMARYERMLKFKQFDDVHYMHFYSVFPMASQTKLYQAVSATHLQDGDSQGFIRRTEEESRFYRIVLSENISLLSKMIGAAWIERSARLVSDAVQADPKLAQQHEVALLEITRPLSMQERSLGKTMEGEFRFHASTIRVLDTEDTPFLERWLLKLTFKKNASLNFAFRNISVWRHLTQLPTEQYLTAEKEALPKLTSPWRDGYISLVYNPAGKILSSISSGAYENYPRRMIDVDGLLRLVSLQIQIAAQNIPETEIPAFLNNTPPQLRDPYTGHAMQWNKTHGLHFRGHGKVISNQDDVVSVSI